MKNRYPDVVGAALGLYGPAYGYNGLVTGAEEDMAAMQAAAMQQAAAQGFGFMPWGCPLPPAQFDPRVPNRELKSVVLGNQCGPLEVETRVGFENGGQTIVAGASVTLVATANVDMKILGLTVPSAQASSFDLTNFTVGIQPVLPGSGPINCQAYQENATGYMHNTPSAQIGQKISCTFTNVGPQDIQRFSPSLRVVCVYYNNRQIYGGPNF